MDLLIFFFTALVGFFGGVLILARSGARYGRTMAFGLLFLSFYEVLFALFTMTGAVVALRLATFFELSSASAFLLSVTSMERGLSKSRSLVNREQQILIAGCILYGILLILFPEHAIFSSSETYLHFGWVMKLQSAAILTTSIIFMWIMENIMRSSTDEQRRILKYPALGIIALGVSFMLMAVYHLSMMRANQDLLILCSLISLVGITFVICFSIRFKLFDLDIFVSRYVVYHSITFMSIGAYLFGIGIFILGVERLGIRLSFVVMGFLVFSVLFTLAFLLISKEAKAHLKFFINTHFFANKYDYRKEWGELSGYLSIAYNEKQIIHVSAQVILDSMYITELAIWLRDGNVFRCAYAIPSLMNQQIPEEENLIEYLRKNLYFLRKTSRVPGDPLWEKITSAKSDFLQKNRIELAASMMVENKLIGFIAVGKENPGTPYGRDDIDLLTAIASQSSAALMSARFAQELVMNKELDTFNRMSSYVLHDLKNAAGNLSLILQNAPSHMDNADFRNDMLETISQTLGRIDKVMTRLGAAPKKGEQSRETVSLELFFENLLSKLSPRLSDIAVVKSIEKELEVTTDPDMLERALENLLINATEAVQNNGRISIQCVRCANRATIIIEDNGTGMTEDFMRDRMFKPFQTTKKHGTGLGLWQVKNIVDQLGGTIDIESDLTEGTRVTVTIPQ